MATTKIPVRENTGNLEILPKSQGIWFTQVVNSLILKVKDISIFAAISIFLKLDKSALVSHLNWHRGKLQLAGENTGNLKMQFEWVP